MRKSLIFLLTMALGFGMGIGGVPYVNAEEEEEFTLEEITVTAQKREENMQKVPITMEVISAEEIKELGKNDISSILSTVSGALVQKGADGYRITIRGMSDDSTAKMGQATAGPTVAMNTDGVFTNRKDGGAGLYDIERVEVLYGPQSTMYSSNSPGGVINIVTAQPKIDTYEGSASLEYGNYNLLHTEGAVNIPLTDKIAIRTSFSSSRRDGYLTNGSDNEKTTGARVRALFQANEELSFTLTAEYSSDQGAGFGGGVEVFANQDDVDDPWTGQEDESLASNDVTSKKLNAQMSWDTSLGSLSVIPSYSKRKGRNEMVMSGDNNLSDLDATEKGLELRMTSSPDFFFTWIAGATYYKSVDDMYSESESYVDSGGTEGNMSDRTMINNNKAYYVNITYPVIDVFRLTAGGRQSWDEMISDNVEFRASMETPGVYSLMPEYLVQENPGKFDWKFGFEYDLNENSMLYGDYSTSYRVQGMSTGDPTTFKDYTLGAKNRFFDNKLQLNVSAYYYNYLNYRAGDMIQVWLYDLDDDLTNEGDVGETVTEPNASRNGDGRVMGFDLQANAIITSKDVVNLSVSYTKSEWKNLIFDYYYTYTLELDEETNTLYKEPLVDYDLRGEPMFNTPPWTIVLNYNHNFYLGNGATIKAGITSKYQTSYKLSWKRTDYPYNYQEDFHTENIDVVYMHPDGKWTLSTYVNNITNYAEKRIYMSPGDKLTIGDPRTYGAVLSVKF